MLFLIYESITLSEKIERKFGMSCRAVIWQSVLVEAFGAGLSLL